MSFVFGYGTALELYRRFADRLLLRERLTLNLTPMRASSRELGRSGWFERLQTRPIHLEVGEARHGHATADTTAHVWGRNYTDWPVIQLDENAYLSSPGFLFLQMASVLERIPLAFLGCELCSIYSPVDLAVEKGALLSSEKSLARFLDAYRGSRGCEKARLVLRSIAQNARSPMEVALLLLLTLPQEQGGYALPKPLLNSTVRLSPSAARIIGLRKIRPDMFWPKAGIVLEYDGKEYHSERTDIDMGARRRLALAEMGIAVLNVTSEQFDRLSNTDALARMVGRALHSRSGFDSGFAANASKRVTLARQLKFIAKNAAALGG